MKKLNINNITNITCNTIKREKCNFMLAIFQKLIYNKEKGNDWIDRGAVFISISNEQSSDDLLKKELSPKSTVYAKRLYSGYIDNIYITVTLVCGVLLFLGNYALYNNKCIILTLSKCT